MFQIRAVEMKVAELARANIANCPCHLAVGQEAVAVGVAAGLRSTDRVFGTHRSHSHYLAMHGEVYPLFAEILARKDGCSSGNGGSMHLIALDKGFKGSVPIVAGTVSIATGAGLAAKMDGNGDVAVAFFGDGAAEEGVVHEAFNIASLMKIPILFVIENNLFSSHLDLEYRQPDKSVARYGEGHRIRTAVVDGNDVVAVENAARDLIELARAGEGPAILEAVTFRWFGHVGPNDDLDVGNHRNMEELAAWKALDPIKRMAEAMIAAGITTQAEIDETLRLIEQDVDAAATRAIDAPWPTPDMLLADVYAS